MLGYISLAELRGSCSARARGRGSLARPKIRAALREASGDLKKDLTQEVRAQLEPVAPPWSYRTEHGGYPSGGRSKAHLEWC